MGLIRLIKNSIGESISKKTINKLDSSESGSIDYFGGKLYRNRKYNNIIVLEFQNGDQRYYSNDGAKSIMDVFLIKE
jgi:hypothetical protein